MEQQIYELLRQCTVRISIQGKTGHGTGFFVIPGLILTCAHVLKVAQSDTSPIEVYWNGKSYPAQITKQQQDLALVQLNLSDHPCVYLQEEAIPFDALYSYGYPDDHPNGDPATFTLEGKAGEQSEQLKFKSGQVRPGLSGAPLLNVRTGHVCGIVQLTRDRGNDLGGRAIPITAVFRVFPELEALQGQFHLQDKHWTSCLWETVASTKYLEAIIRRYSSVTLPIGPTQDFSLQAIFQPLKLRRDPLAAEDLTREQRRALLGESKHNDEDPRRAFPGSRRSGDQSRQTSPVVIAENADDALKKSSRRSIVVLGGPGTGKTILLKYLVYDQAKKALAEESVPLPIFISLPDLARSNKTLKEYLTSVVQDMMIDERFAQVLWKALEQGKAFVCLDSLDEVAPNLRPEKIRLINEWASSTNSTYVVGSRFTDYKGGQLKEEWFAEWELQPMNLPLRKELAKRLLPELYRLISPGNVLAQNILAFVNALEKHEQAAAWGENILLFSLAAVVFACTGTLPPSRALLYQQVIDAVLETRELNRLRRGMLGSVLACLSLELFQEKGRTFTHDDLLRFLRIVRRRQDERWDTEEIAQRIIDSGILEVVAHDTYGFRHQTFQEYFAAVELAQRMVSRDRTIQEQAWDLAWSKRTYSRWTEVLRLTVGVLTQMPGKEGMGQALHWLHALAGQRKTTAGDPGNLGLMLALTSLGELVEVEEQQTTHLAVLEAELVLAWVEEFLSAAQREQYEKVSRLQILAYEIGRLQERSVKIALNRLTLALDSDYDNIRRMVPGVLGMLGKWVPLELLLKTLHDEDSFMKKEAIKALGMQGERTPLEPLLEALHDWNEEVQRAAIEVFRNQKERLSLESILENLYDKHTVVRSATIRLLGALGEHAPLEPLLEALHDQHGEVRQAAIEALGMQGERVPLEPLLEALHDEYLYVRKAAVKILGRQGKRVPLEPLLEALHDQHGEVRQAAIEALGMQGERVPLEPLLEALRDELSFVRRAALDVLGRLGERVPLEPLLEVVNNEKSYLRSAAIEALGRLGDRVPLEILLKALYDEDSGVRRAAVEALGRQGERAPLEHLFEAIVDQNKRVVRMAAEVLNSLAPHTLHRVVAEAIAILQKQSPGSIFGVLAQKFIAEVIGGMGLTLPLVFDILIPMLDSPFWQVRLNAVHALGELRRSIPDVAIQRLLELRLDPDPMMQTIREAADNALAKILSLETGIEDI